MHAPSQPPPPPQPPRPCSVVRDCSVCLGIVRALTLTGLVVCAQSDLPPPSVWVEVLRGEDGARRACGCDAPAPTQAIMTVLELPPSESCSSRVSLDSRYGTCDAIFFSSPCVNKSRSKTQKGHLFGGIQTSCAYLQSPLFESRSLQCIQPEIVRSPAGAPYTEPSGCVRPRASALWTGIRRAEACLVSARGDSMAGRAGEGEP